MPQLQPQTQTSVVRSRTENWQPGWVQSITDEGIIDVSICIANWNCQDYLRQCLESLLDQPQGVRLEVIVVDNDSHDESVEMITTAFPEVKLVRNAENRGFAVASNQAAQQARGRYFFFLNNDTIVPAGTLRQLIEFADQHPEAGMIGPRLRDGNGKVQISYRQHPTIAAMLHRTALFRWTGLWRGAYRRYRRASFQERPDQPVQILMGAAVLVRDDIFQQSGGWDEAFHFGGEDIDLSHRIGGDRPLIYLSDVEITHFGRISSRQNVEFAAPNVTIGYVHYFRKTGSSRWALVLYKTCLTVDAPLQLIGKSLQYLWRKLWGREEKARKSLIACRGLWRFLRHELGRFWRA